MIHRPLKPLREQKESVDKRQLMLTLVRLWADETDPKVKSLIGIALNATKKACKLIDAREAREKKAADNARRLEKLELQKIEFLKRKLKNNENH